MIFEWGNGQNPEIFFTNQNDMYLHHVSKIKTDFSSGNAIEIGPGSGEFACRFSQEYNMKKYTLLDLKRVIHYSESTLKRCSPNLLVESIYAEEYKKSFSKQYDVLISNVCIPETPEEYRTDLLNNLIPLSKSAMIIGQLDETGQDYKNWITGLFSNNYQNVLCDLTDYKNCYALIGY